MGERQKGDGVRGRRRVHPGHPGGAAEPAVFGPQGTGRPDTGSVGVHTVEALLGAALLVEQVDSEAEQRAVAAFRAARDAGPHRAARTRRRDDWRPRERRASRSLRTTLSVVLASLTLGGVAFAAIGTSQPAAGGTDYDRGRPHPSTSGSDRSDGSPVPGSGATAVPSDRPVTAKDLLAHCRAYEKVAGDGTALDATAWRRLVTAAGGGAKVTAYCAERLKDAAAAEKGAGRPDSPGKEPGTNGGTGDGQNKRSSGGGQSSGSSDRTGQTGQSDQTGQGDQTGTTGTTGEGGTTGRTGTTGGSGESGQTGQSGQTADRADQPADEGKESKN
ncbi:hypothetical protein [Streptomyces sp. NPDC001658]